MANEPQISAPQENDVPAVINQENKELFQALTLADSVVYKAYLDNLNDKQIVPCPPALQEANINDLVRFFKVQRFVSEKNENNRDKLISVFHAVAGCGGSVLILIHSDSKKISYYLGTKTPNVRTPDILDNSVEALEKTLKGNFPGTSIESVRGGNELNELVDSVFLNSQFSKQEKQVFTITGVAGLRAKEENHEKLFVQGMEKLVDSMQGEKYSLLLIADPVDAKQVETIKAGYESLYTQIVPFSGAELSFGENKSSSIAKSFSENASKAISHSVTDTLTYTIGASKTVGVSVGADGAGANASSTVSVSRAKAHGITDGITEAFAITKGKTDTESEGTSRGIQIKRENKTFKNMLEKIDLQLKRLNTSADTGMWNCSVYCFADVASVGKIVASAYQSLLRGENSSIEFASVTEWTKENTKAILPYLEKMHHPVLKLDENNEITPTSFINSAELTIHAGIPQTSVSGLPVLKMASFGREVMTHWTSGKKSEEKAGINLGNIYHMGNEDTQVVVLNKKSLASHTFITGSTGSGKSNTIYQLLAEVQKAGASFLVVESAKGEYKHVFGNSGATVYGTNPGLTHLLRINPFTFPTGDKNPAKNVHILEHLDRLVEIFNVCWPMYAAMPAVLKDAIEAAYEEAGWDLQTSVNRFIPAIYPAFADIVKHIKTIIDSSEYSDENKGNYKGSLITRLKSLTNGINGMIFVPDELTKEELFDNNVIVDLSRVGSVETKALIMGLLVMKLQEYRLTSGTMNADLRHVTVLEEAHNLLKRTSTEQSSEGANLLGKSVEMLANAIAEMRTYGEGFIIADQSPGLLDMSVIRNTNTKIILRLPDENDRILVGKAANLSDDQIVELAKLQCGVAAVYQNDWLEPVLCKVREFKEAQSNEPFQKADENALKKSEALAELRKLALQDSKIEKLKEKIDAVDFMTFKSLAPKVIAGLFRNNQRIFREAKDEAVAKKTQPMKDLTEYLENHLEPSLSLFAQEYQRHILECIVIENCKHFADMSNVPVLWVEFINNKEAHHGGKLH